MAHDPEEGDFCKREPFSALAMSLLEARESFSNRFRPMLRLANMTEQQWRMLRTLHFSGPLPMLELDEAAKLPRPSTSRMVHQLELHGVLARRPVPGDRRKVEIFLTPSGRALILAMEPLTEAAYAEIVGTFGSAKIQKLRALLADLSTEIENLPPLEIDHDDGASSQRIKEREPG